MLAIDENTITDAALEQMGATPDLRLKQVMAALVRHLHAFAREVDLTAQEWLEGIKFLTAVSRVCTPYRLTICRGPGSRRATKCVSNG